MSAMVESLDVFDTVLVRRVADPRAVFRWIGIAAREQRLTSVDSDEFGRQRAAAETACRQRAGATEITLTAIATELATRLGLPPSQANALAELELEAERRLITALPGAAAWIGELRARPARIVFASDMYLPAAFLQARLAEAGCWQPGDGLYVSADCGQTKASGGMFRLILEREKLTPGQLHHSGNHADADFATPRRLGVPATLRADGNPNRYEDELESFAPATAGLASLHAGASRLARLTAAEPFPAAEPIRAVAAGVAGPVLSSYVSWVLRKAQRQKLTRLYFVARDGWVLLGLARQLAPQLCPGIELRYLHGSRQAWHLPGIFSLGAPELDWLFCPTDFLSITAVCARIGVRPDEMAEALTAAGFERAQWDRDLAAGERLVVREVFGQPRVSALVLERAAAARRDLLAYLRQEGLLTAEPCGLVDVGWHGRAHDSLAKVIVAAGFAPPAGFYFGLNSASGLTGLGDRHAWFFDRRAGAPEPQALPGLEPLIETFCTAGHGATLGYRGVDGRIEPILREANPTLATWGWPAVQLTLDAYGRHLAQAPAVAADEAAVRAMCLAVLRLFWEQPTPTEAAAWGAFPYEDDQASATSRPLAETLAWRQVTALAFRGRTGPHRASWWHGSQALTPPVRRAVLASVHRLRRLARAGKHALS